LILVPDAPSKKWRRVRLYVLWESMIHFFAEVFAEAAFSIHFPAKNCYNKSV